MICLLFNSYVASSHLIFINIIAYYCLYVNIPVGSSISVSNQFEIKNLLESLIGYDSHTYAVK